jgi:drug/metabolite transporter (DMT)-like permease
VTVQAMGILSYIEPVSAAVLTWAILGQSFGWQVAVGGALVVLAGAIVVLFEPAETGWPGGAAPASPSRSSASPPP